MPAPYYNDEGQQVRECLKCHEVLPTKDYYGYKENGNTDSLQSTCRVCTLTKYRDQNRRRAKKRKQKSHKLTPLQVQWIKEQQGKISIRQTAKQFSKRFFACKINPSTVQRIFAGKIHVDPGEEDTLSVYDLLEGASEFSGSIEDYLESADTDKVKF